MTTELDAASVQIAEDEMRRIIRDEMSEGRSRSLRWDGTINLGHLLTMGAMIGGMLLTYSTFDKRLALVEAGMTRQTEVLDRTIRTDEQLRAIRERLDKLERGR
ncbi:hypothetical protein V5F38_04990 [Xanthobacter sp. V0B-10]|uniref:hypothetical protein n=1 Tax=Xanthobacter albus TaxID=3119929 RepID=UPI00372B5978